MTTFDDRETAFESKFAHDEEIRFRIHARRNRLLGLWAARLLGKSETQAELYAKSILRAALYLPGGDEGLIGKLADDLGDRAALDTIRAKMAAFARDAEQQITATPAG